MSQIETIRDLGAKGYTPGEIRRRTGVSYPTIRKYLEKDDFSPVAPVEETRASKLDPYKDAIDAMLEQDRHVYRKQHHTARRVFERLVDEAGYDGSYSTVLRYVREARARTAARCYLDLVWHEGEMQGDFGQADFMLSGVQRRMHYLALTFPFSNVGYMQVFHCEKAECICQGMRDVFEHVGGVPVRIVLDNATEAGRRVGTIIRESELFHAFRMHYGFEVTFTNPYAGNEKGNVENFVGAGRRRYFVPMPQVDDIVAYNAGLLATCDSFSERSVHHGKGRTCAELFGEERPHLLPLPARPFDCVRYVTCTADGYGRITCDTCHSYLASAELSGRRVMAGLRAFTVDILSREGHVVRSYPRSFGDDASSESDPLAALGLLSRKPGAFRNSPVREMLGDASRAYMDALGREERGEKLATMLRVAGAHGFDTAVAALEETVAGTGRAASCDVEMTAVAIAARGGAPAPTGGGKLIAYDSLLGRDGEVGRHAEA